MPLLFPFNSLTGLVLADLCGNFLERCITGIQSAFCFKPPTASCDSLELFGLDGINRQFKPSLYLAKLPSRRVGLLQTDRIGQPIPVLQYDFVGLADTENQAHHHHAQQDAHTQMTEPLLHFARVFDLVPFSRHFFGDEHGRPMPMHNCRIGEALNPGPDGCSSCPSDQDNPSLINIVITNPTAVYQKARCLNELSGDLLMLSENSATTQVQTLMSKEFKQLGYKSIWGHPAAQQIRDGNPNSLRGAAVGVSVHSKLPVRPARLTPDTDWYTSGRFLHCFVQLPGLEIQVCTVYGLPASVATAKTKTDSLLEHAHHAIRHTTFPALICGDLNHHPSTLESWSALRAAGYVSAEELYIRKTGQPLPPTYGDSTCNDVCLLSPTLAQFVKDISVDQQKLVAGHNPLLVSFELPGVQIYRYDWQLPHPWINFQPRPDLIEQHYQPIFNIAGDRVSGDNHDDLHLLQIWSATVEKAVHEAIAAESRQDPANQPHQGLPHRCRGRCQPRKFIHKPMPQSIKAACAGQYTPDVDHASIRLRQHTRQVRRLHSLRLRIQKGKRLHSLSPRTIEQLWDEWNCILQAPGFPGGFQNWLRSHPELINVPNSLPDDNYLYQAEQLLQFTADKMVYEHKVRAKRHAQYMQDLDAKRFGKKMAFRQVKEPSPGLVNTVSFSHSQDVPVLQQPQYGIAVLARLPESKLDVTQPLMINDNPSTILQFDDETIEVMIHDELEHLPSPITISQTFETTNPTEVAANLTAFWTQYWNRDSTQQQLNPNRWEDFLSLQNDLPPKPQVHLPPISFEDCKEAIQHMKSATSRSCCGWAADELKNLPDNCIHDLARVMQSLIPDGFPSWLMHAKVVAVAKTHNANHAASTRPITVLSLIYRLWGRITTRRILEQWSHTLPDSITGFLPKRNAQTSIYRTQLHLEATNHGLSSQQWGGLTLDLIKAFNTIPHAPTKSFLLHLGLPRELLDAWMNSIQNMTRHWCIDQQAFFVPRATTGLPEGDAWSVLGMVGLNMFMISNTQPLIQQLQAYADNWSYYTSLPAQHLPTIRMLQRVTKALALAIDWTKTWGWGTSDAHKNALKNAKQECLSADVELRQVTSAKDLGYIMHYRLSPFRGSQKQRHQLALARLTKLRKQDLPLGTKAHIAMAAGVHKALYGAHTYLTGERYFSELRSKIAEALLGDHHNIQPYIACSCLTSMVTDPELWLIQQAIKEARSFLVTADQSTSAMFFRLASTTVSAAHLITGPGMALGAYVNKLGWQVTRLGTILTDTAQFDLRTCNLEDLMHASTVAWMKHVSDTLLTRKDLRNTPPINAHDTIQVFQKIPDDKQVSVGIDVTMGYMTNHQKAQFDSAQDEDCTLCGHLDSHEHRVLRCSATEVVRRKYPELCAYLEEHHPMHFRLPVLYADPEVEFLRCMLDNFPEPVVHNPAVKPQYLFTDGSCSMPGDRIHRWASFAIVATALDLSSLPLHLLQDTTWLLHNAFDTLATSHVTGNQTVSRAELQAAVLAQELEYEVPVVSDSQYVISSHMVVVNTEDILVLHKKKNYDLLRRLHLLYWDKQKDIPVRKIKSHQTITTNDEINRLRAGNAVADLAAVLTHRTFAKPLTDQLLKHAEDAKERKAMLTQQLSMRQELAEMRKRLTDDTVQTMSFAEQATHLFNWSVLEPQTFDIADDMFQIAHASKWGTVFTVTVMDYLRTLKWPKAPDTSKVPTGITWFELTCNFMLVTQQSVPVNISAKGQPPVYHRVEDHPSFDPQAYSFGAATASFRDCISMIQTLLQHDILPTLKPRKVKSLRLLGSTESKQGIVYRPEMWRQRETLEMIQQYCQQDGTMTSFSTWPSVPKLAPCIEPRFGELPGDTQEAKQRRYKERRWHIRQSQ